MRLFVVSCQALGMTGEMREIIDDLDGRRRALFEEAVLKVRELRKIAAELGKTGDAKDSESLLDDEQKKELARWKNLTRYRPPVIDVI